MEIRKAATDAAKEQLSKPENILKAANLANTAQAYAADTLKEQ